MVYNNIKKAIFVNRENRFIAKILIDGKIDFAHIKNTGRCKELLIKDATIFVSENFKVGRKTKYDLINVYKKDVLINMDSSIPNKVFNEWAKNGGFIDDITYIKAEKQYKNSRFDFYIETSEKKIFVEVKGVTLEENNIAMFPDAPTTRGVKHINELIDAKKNGFYSYIVFVIQMSDIKYFTPNYKTHKEFCDVLKKAKDNGVNIVAVTSIITKNSIVIDKRIPVKL